MGISGVAEQRQRQAHRKSRKGCARCKRAHRKCDEAPPRCGACMRAGTTCSLESVPASNDRQDDELPLAVDDLRLLHHWMQGDGRLFADHDADRARRDRDVQVALALEHPFLMHAILGLAALELFHRDPSDFALYKAAASHNRAALRAARPQIIQTSREYSEPLFLFSAFAALYAFAEPPLRALSPAHQGSVDALRGLLDAFSMGRGIVAIMNANQQYLEETGTPDRTQWPDDTAEVMPTLHADFPQLQLLLDLIQLHSQEMHRSRLIEDTTKLFAIISLLQRRPKTHSSARLIQTWPMHVCDSLLRLWNARDPVALILLAHYAVAVHLRANLWFFQRWPDLVLRCIHEVIASSWHRYLEWPRSVVSVP